MRKVLYILGQLSDDDIEWLIENGTRRAISPETVIIEERGALHEMFIVLDGRFSVTVSALGDQEVASLGAGELVGEMSFVDSRPPSATVTAVEESSVLTVDREELAERLEEDEGFASRFYRAVAVFLADRMRGTVARLGYSGDEELDEDTEYEDELSMDVLDNVHLAGARFERILKRLAGA